MVADGIVRSSPTIQAYVKVLFKNTVLLCRVPAWGRLINNGNDEDKC